MADYSYIAQDSAGKKVYGRKQAQNETELQGKLKEKGLLLLKAETRENYHTKELRPAQTAAFCRQLGNLIVSGIPLVKAMAVIVNQETISEKEKNNYLKLMEYVKQGLTLSEAMDAADGVFPKLLINLFRSAEAGGNLGETSLRMADHYEKEHRLSEKVRGVLVYPKILCVVTIFVVMIIMGFVIPRFKVLFSQMDSLPVPTAILLWISSVVQNNFISIIVILLLLFAAFHFISLLPCVKQFSGQVILKLPLAGKLLRIIYTARFARTLSSLYSSGITIVTALPIAASTVGNTYIEKQFDKVVSELKKGTVLSSAVCQVDGLTSKLTSAIKIGEESGSLEKCLESTADQLEYESEMALLRLVSYIEPLMIIIMALIVGFIMIAVILPVYKSYSFIGGGSL